ncbi:hypothetical protein ACFXNW_09980 [Nocardia sp. NPDC059180]|uniref:hypothetical protein n=1 Tax=Nocardia sp. NPDC059180 TaxID=3346761 RepID=UPI00368152A4
MGEHTEAHPYARWLGRYLAEVPVKDHSGVFAWVYGVSLTDACVFAEHCAWRNLSSGLRYMSDDIASRVMGDLVLNPLPDSPVRNWRAYIERNVVDWKVKELLRREQALKRDAGMRIDDPDAVSAVAADCATDELALLHEREYCAYLVARMPLRYRPVFEAIFHISADGIVRRTIREAAQLLQMPDGTVRRLSAEGMPLFHKIVEEEKRKASAR